MRAVVITPLAVSAPYWTKLLQASVIPGPEGYERLSRQQNALPDSDATGELALFAVDFSAGQTRLRTPSAPPCGREAEFRGRCPSGSPADQAERARIHAHLDAVGPPPPSFFVTPLAFDHRRVGPSGPPMVGYLYASRLLITSLGSGLGPSRLGPTVTSLGAGPRA